MMTRFHVLALIKEPDMTKQELETLRGATQLFWQEGAMAKSIRAAVALIARLPTFADGAPMVTPCDAWIVPARWSWLSEMDGGEQPEMVTIWNFRHGNDGGHYCLSFEDSSDLDFGFGPVYQTEQAARESMAT